MLMLKGISKGEHNSPEDFTAEVEEGALLIPQGVMKAIEPLSIRTAEEFVSYTQSFPSAVAGVLHWSIEDVNHINKVLTNALQGAVSDSILYPSPPQRRGYGALNPRKYGKKNHGSNQNPSHE